MPNKTPLKKVKPYILSFGHFWTRFDASQALKELQEKGKHDLKVGTTHRKKSKWKKHLVYAEVSPKKVKVSNDKRKKVKP